VRSNQRSADTRQTPSGKKKKKLLNARRSRGSLPPLGEGARDSQESQRKPGSPSNRRPDELPPNVELRIGNVIIREADLANSRMLSYARMMTNLTEGI